MHKLLIKIVQILDGTPAVYGKRQAGQSVVELALITPILIILLAGLVEIGWFANNYLNLMDVTRAGARRGAVLQDQQSPLFWNNVYSYVPNAELPGEYQMTNSVANGTDLQRYLYRGGVPFSAFSHQSLEANVCNPDYRSFYGEIICVMSQSMQPMVLNPSNGVDDIIISGFSLQLVDGSVPIPLGEPQWLPAGHTVPGNVPQMVVAGRYPSNANECDVLDVSGTPIAASRPGDENRDPFDLNGDGVVQVAPPSGSDHFTELTGYDAPIDSNPSDAGYDANWEQDSEKQVGFSLFGNHKIDGTFCVGSDWTLTRVEELMNLPNFDLTNNTAKDYLPSQGLLLVEMYWQHEMLLKIPILSPVYTAVGNQDGKMVINVWAAFPLASTEPHILFTPY